MRPCGSERDIAPEELENLRSELQRLLEYNHRFGIALFAVIIVLFLVMSAFLLTSNGIIHAYVLIATEIIFGGFVVSVGLPARRRSARLADRFARLSRSQRFVALRPAREYRAPFGLQPGWAFLRRVRKFEKSELVPAATSALRSTEITASDVGPCTDPGKAAEL